MESVSSEESVLYQRTHHPHEKPKGISTGMTYLISLKNDSKSHKTKESALRGQEATMPEHFKEATGYHTHEVSVWEQRKNQKDGAKCKISAKAMLKFKGELKIKPLLIHKSLSDSASFFKLQNECSSPFHWDVKGQSFCKHMQQITNTNSEQAET